MPTKFKSTKGIGVSAVLALTASVLFGLNQPASAAPVKAAAPIKAQTVSGETSSASSSQGCDGCSTPVAKVKTKKATARKAVVKKAPTRARAQVRVKVSTSPCRNITAMVNGRKVRTTTAKLREFAVIADAEASALATSGDATAAQTAKATATAKAMLCSYTIKGMPGFYQALLINGKLVLVRCDAFIISASAKAAAEAGVGQANKGVVAQAPASPTLPASTKAGSSNGCCGSSASASGTISVDGKNCTVNGSSQTQAQGSAQATASGKGNATCTPAPPVVITVPVTVPVTLPPTIVIVTVPGTNPPATTTVPTATTTTVPSTTTTVPTATTTTVPSTTTTTTPIVTTTTKPVVTTSTTIPATTTIPVTVTTFVPSPTCTLATSSTTYRVGQTVLLDVRYNPNGWTYQATNWFVSGSQTGSARTNPMDWSFVATTVGSVTIEAYGEFTLPGLTRVTGKCTVTVSITPPPVLKCSGVNFVGTRPVGNGISYFSNSSFSFTATVDAGLTISSWRWVSVPGSYAVAWAPTGGPGNTWSITIPSGTTPGIDTNGTYAAVAYDSSGQELCRTPEITVSKRDA